MKPIQLSDAMIDRLNELNIPDTMQIRMLLHRLYLNTNNNFLFVRDLPNGMKEVEVIEQPSTHNKGNNGTNTESPPT